MNEAPTIHRSSVLLLVALNLAFFDKMWIRDVEQAFVQSEDPLKCSMYIISPKGDTVLDSIGDPPGSLLKVIKPLYGMPESPVYWLSTMRNHHVNVLGMNHSILYPVYSSSKTKET